MNRQLRIHLAWQHMQMRRWSPDRFANVAQNDARETLLTLQQHLGKE